jgi:hypothetical protein
MDLTECNVDISLNEYVWDNTISYGYNIIGLYEKIESFEKNKEYRKALIHLGIYFIIKENSIKEDYHSGYYTMDEIYSEVKGKTLYNWFLNSYEADQYFKQVCDNWDNFLKENTHTK